MTLNAFSYFVGTLFGQQGIRSDGRGLSDIRPIQSLCGLLPRAHGSALFTRGETQVRQLFTGLYLELDWWIF